MRTELFHDRRLVAAITGISGAAALLMLAVCGLTAQGFVFANGGVLGGDHVAFWTAGRAALTDTWASIYEPAAFEAAMSEAGIAKDRLGLTWQYPPHAAALLAPFGLLPFAASWLVWTAASLTLFAVALRRGAGVRPGDIALVLLSPALVQVVITGQTGAFAGAALIGALLLPARRPVLAGVCAGLLTVKPQFGLLIPFAFLAGGYYRSAFVAASTAGALGIAATLIVGAEAWGVWWTALTGVAEGVGEGAYPLFKMVTVFAALRSAGVPEALAFGLQAAAFLLAAALTVRLWRSAAPPEARAAVTACLVFLTTPYAYYYDTAVLALPVLFVIGRLDTPAFGRRALLALCAFVPMAITSMGPLGAHLGLAGVLVLTILTLRAAAPQTRLSLAPA